LSAVLVEDLWYTYPGGLEPALRGVNLRVSRGEVVAIIGENGAGKTTLAKHLIGLLKPQRGRVEVFGLDAAKAKVHQLARYVGFAFQNPDHQLFAETVQREVEFAPKNLGFPPGEVAKRVEETLRKLRLTALKDRPPLALSSGERRRVALASILSHGPSLLILDEPTVGQDGAQKRQLASLIRRFAEGGGAVAVITHDLDFVAEFVPRVVVMSKGVVIADGPVDEVLVDEALLSKASLRPPASVELVKSLVEHGLLHRVALYRSLSKLADELMEGLRS